MVETEGTILLKMNEKQEALTGQQFNAVKRLLAIERKLHKRDEQDCNFSFSEAQEARRVGFNIKLMREASDLAVILGYYSAYHQGDPRGCALYLLTKEQAINPQSLYSQGLAIHGGV